jgi:methylated-DNA-[protein]-cysteine S-methyltransferase
LKKIMPAETAYCRRRAPLGHFLVLWAVHRGQPKIVRVLLSGPQSSIEMNFVAAVMTAKADTCLEIEAIAVKMEAFLGGADVSFSLDSVRLDICSAFQQQVLRAEHGIPRSQVSTYQLIARFIGKPSAARAVGTALANNPFPIIIPCHRAVRSDRTLGGFQGGLPMKKALLQAEGICFDSAGRVAVEDFFYSSPSNVGRPLPANS